MTVCKYFVLLSESKLLDLLFNNLTLAGVFLQRFSARFCKQVLEMDVAGTIFYCFMVPCSILILLILREISIKYRLIMVAFVCYSLVILPVIQVPTYWRNFSYQQRLYKYYPWNTYNLPGMNTNKNTHICQIQEQFGTYVNCMLQKHTNRNYYSNDEWI